jgi:hypothetical protein
MNLLVFATLKGAMIAILGMSTPAAPLRSCLIVRHALLDQHTARGPEAWSSHAFSAKCCGRANASTTRSNWHVFVEEG